MAGSSISMAINQQIKLTIDPSTGKIKSDATFGKNIQFKAFGQTFNLTNLQLDDNEDMKRKFDALAVGGQVQMAIHDAFWGATFGMLKDQFGIAWMFVGPKR